MEYTQAEQNNEITDEGDPGNLIKNKKYKFILRQNHHKGRNYGMSKTAKRRTLTYSISHNKGSSNKHLHCYYLVF